MLRPCETCHISFSSIVCTTIINHPKEVNLVLWALFKWIKSNQTKRERKKLRKKQHIWYEKMTWLSKINKYIIRRSNWTKNAVKNLITVIQNNVIKKKGGGQARTRGCYESDPSWHSPPPWWAGPRRECRPRRRRMAHGWRGSARGSAAPHQPARWDGRVTDGWVSGLALTIYYFVFIFI